MDWHNFMSSPSDILESCFHGLAIIISSNEAITQIQLNNVNSKDFATSTCDITPNASPGSSAVSD
jgi:hypothetical protein